MHELTTVPEGVAKIRIERDAKVRNAASFVLAVEDHTIGNLLRMQLLRYDDVLFAGYRMPHPLENRIVVRVQTTGRRTPAQALSTAIGHLEAEAAGLGDHWAAACRDADIALDDAVAADGGDVGFSAQDQSDLFQLMQ